MVGCAEKVGCRAGSVGCCGKVNAGVVGECGGWDAGCVGRMGNGGGAVWE